MINVGMAPHCPLNRGGVCAPNCMLFLTATDADSMTGPTDRGEGCCAFAVLASHIASEKHYGGNYLMHMAGFDYRQKGADVEEGEDDGCREGGDVS